MSRGRGKLSQDVLNERIKTYKQLNTDKQLFMLPYSDLCLLYLYRFM